MGDVGIEILLELARLQREAERRVAEQAKALQGQESDEPQMG